MKYPNRLHILREARGLSLDRLAAVLGLSKGAVQKYNNGSVEMGASRLLQIAEILMVQPEELLTEQAPRIVNRIAAVRESRGLLIDDLAARLGWPLWKVRAAEMATRYPPAEAGLQIAQALDVPISAILFDMTTASEEAKAMAGIVDGLEEADRRALYRHADALAQSHTGPDRKTNNG